VSDRDIGEAAQLAQRFQIAPEAEVVKITAEAAFPEWHATPKRHLIGGGFRDDSTRGFQLAHSAVIMRDGSLFVASYRPPFARFPGDGPGVDHLGRAGEGPGEYRQIQWIGRFRGDSLKIWDGSLRRLARSTPRAALSPRPDRSPSFGMHASSGRAGSSRMDASWRSAEMGCLRPPGTSSFAVI